MLTEEALRGASLEVQQFLMKTVPEEEMPHQFSEEFEKRIQKTIRWECLKRWIPSIIFLSVALVVIICSLLADPNNTLWLVPLSEADKEYVKNKVVLQCDTIVQWGGEGWQEPYYGTINNCVVVQTSLPGVMWIDPQPASVEVAGYCFKGASPDFNLCVLRDGEACTLEQAYEKGWLTKEQIGKLYERHQEIYAVWLETQEDQKETQGS